MFPSVYTRACSSLKIFRRPASAAASFCRWHTNSSSNAAHRACAADKHACMYVCMCVCIQVLVKRARACAAARFP